MGFLLKPAMFKSMDKVADVRNLLKKDVKNSVGKDVSFVAATKVKIGSTVESVFVLTDDTKAWETVLKERKPASLISGSCQVFQGSPTRIVVKSTAGGNKAAVIKAATDALKDSAFVPVDSADVARELAQASHDKAGTGVKITNDLFVQMVKVTSELGEYKKFADAFEKLATDYKMANYKKVPVNIWADLLKGLVKSGYVSEKIPKAKDGTSFILAVKGPDGKVVRDKLLADGMVGLKKFTSHAETYLNKVVDEVRKAGGKPTWSFWSGAGAQHAAQKWNTGGVVLEGSVGSWFKDVWDFKPLTGVENLVLWTSLSELYAETAAKNYEHFSFRGYVGPGATREQSVFNMIEQPRFVEVLNVKKPDGRSLPRTGSRAVAWSHRRRRPAPRRRRAARTPGRRRRASERCP